MFGAFGGLLGELILMSRMRDGRIQGNAQEAIDDGCRRIKLTDITVSSMETNKISYLRHHQTPGCALQMIRMAIHHKSTEENRL